MNIDKQALREAAEKATPGRVGDRIDGSGSIKYECRGYDDSLVLRTDHKNMEYGFVGDNANADELFFRLCAPDVVLALLDELDSANGYASAYEAEKWHYHGLAESEGERADRAEKALVAAEKRIAELEMENEYIRNRYKELDLLIGKNILVMQAAIIEWQATSDAKKGLAWIYNTLFGPGELPDEAEKDAQAYFDRKYAPLDEEIMKLHQWFWERSEAERAAAGIGKGE
ncbi:ead/Ea22-like family protein [Salmonella enterica subsp. enterica]|nr:ead/Ea22-like family protein [Salmonella enterica subsp. enterica]EEA7993706.1 ead/Ea22-like family protein [Salmonella enterica subsp. enterica]